MITVSDAGRRRALRHLAIWTVSVAAMVGLAAVLPGERRERISTASAYVALGLLAITLSLGPLNLLRGRPNPVSFNQRRDFGIWSAIVGVGHAMVGLTVHLRGHMARYFFPEPGRPSLAGLRADPFGLANHTGLIAALLLLVLGTISNDWALRTLGTRRWRTIQRSAYVVAGLTIVHAALYQGLEKQRLLLVLVFVSVSATVLVVQVLAARRHR